MVNLELKDTQYQENGFTHTRVTSRGIVLDEEGRIALHFIHRDDIFGNETYYETPGGGVDEGETPEQAVIRECKEELGEDIEVLRPLGVVKDAYNLIHRKNENHYFLCKKLNQGEKHFVSEGDSLIQKTVWVSLEEGIALLKKQSGHGVSALVKARELPILEEARRVLFSKIS